MNRKIRTILVSIIANIALIALKFLIVGLSGSVALKASAWHSLSDLFPSFVVLLGLMLTRKAEKESSGLINKIENVIAIIISGFIFFAGIKIVGDAFSSEMRDLRNLPIATVISLLSIIVAYFMSRYQIYVGKETNSPGLIANGSHAKADMYSSLVVLGALLGAIMGFPAMDRVAAGVIAFLIFKNGIEVAIDAIRRLIIKNDGVYDLENHDIREIAFKKAMRKLMPLGFASMLLIYFVSGIYIVKWNEVAIVKRFGKSVREVQPGLRYRLPWPIEKADTVATSELRSEKVPNTLMLTGDSNLLEIEAVAYYKISEPKHFLYNISDPKAAIRGTVAVALRKYINGAPADSVLTIDKNEMQQTALETAQKALDELKSGVSLVNVLVVRDVPPDAVMEAFRDVASAREDKSTYINEALAYQAELIPKARGDAQKSIEEATTYSENRINTASGDASRFLQKSRAYRLNPDITETRMYLEAVERSLANAKKVILDKRVRLDTTDLWLNGNGPVRTIKEMGKQ
ncbi:MAG: FtsH protease activity modulator HflK [Rectinemataceae bacterium]|nr:FtsH protease activity modulator HflK [Rectinemataceae bacterium]